MRNVKRIYFLFRAAFSCNGDFQKIFEKFSENLKKPLDKPKKVWYTYKSHNSKDSRSV